MNNIIRQAHVFAILILFAGPGFAQSGETYTIQVTVKDSAAEQVALARSLISTNLRSATTGTERRTAIATAAETLEVVPRMWPNDRPQIISAAMIEADLFIVANSPKDALRVLIRAEPVAKNGRGIAAIHLRMGRAYARLHDDANAELLLMAAEREAPPEGKDVLSAVRLDLADNETQPLVLEGSGEAQPIPYALGLSLSHPTVG